MVESTGGPSSCRPGSSGFFENMNVYAISLDLALMFITTTDGNFRERVRIGDSGSILTTLAIFPGSPHPG